MAWRSCQQLHIAQHTSTDVIKSTIIMSTMSRIIIIMNIITIIMVDPFLVKVGCGKVVLFGSGVCEINAHLKNVTSFSLTPPFPPMQC
jgi:hypothetical protein